MDGASWETIAKVLGAAAPLVVGLIGIGGADFRLRRTLKQDAEIAALLPAGSDQQKALLQHIGEQVDRVRDRASRTRDWSSFGLALVCAPFCGLYGVVLLLNDTWWVKIPGVALVGLAMVFVFGVFESAQLSHRDEKGRRIDKPR